jgi:RND superfamily putative drug exporter
VLRLSLGFASERASAVVAQAEEITASRARSAARLRAAFSGEATLGRDYLAAIEEGGQRSGLATIALVAVTLCCVYRAPLAALVSLATSAPRSASRSARSRSRRQLGLPVAYQSRGFLVALLFGIGTDYCLLLFARVREASRRAGRRSRSAPPCGTRRP